MAQTPTSSESARTDSLSSYVGAVRAHRMLVGLVTLATLIGALLWIAVRDPAYESTANLLVSPIPSDDQTLLGLPVVRDSPGEPTRAIQTAATLVESPAAARLAATRLGGDWSPGSVASAVEVEPQGQSNIIAITGQADTPEESARVATDYARASLEGRKALLAEQAAAALERLPAADAAGTTGDSPFATIAERRASLEGIRENGDPSLVLSQEASPGERTGPSAPLVIVLALFGGAALGIGAAILREMLDRSLRDESEALTIYPLPILARVPLLSRRQERDGRNRVWYTPPSVREAYRTLMAQIPEAPGPGGTALMVTSASHGDGKTTSAVNLAAALAAAGKSVVLLDFDLRKPNIAAQLGLKGTEGVADLLDSKRELSDLLTPVPQLPSMQVFSPARGSEDVSDIDALAASLPGLVDEARLLADWVIVDTAPLGEVSDALRVTRSMDNIVIVVRPARTNRVNFEMMRDLLERVAQTPLGMVVIGHSGGVQTSPYSYGTARRELFKPTSGVT
ncbi:MAG TPA: P-loop NTPase [Thermoleophilaceae bacterium]|nr:P-loop NTPase [Thermoleophilaceae bacterium]